MALTGRVISSGYRKDQYDLKSNIGLPATMGVPLNLPAGLCTLTPVAGTVTANGVTMNTIIKLLPTGLNQQPVSYYVADSIATIQSNGT